MMENRLENVAGLKLLELLKSKKKQLIAEKKILDKKDAHVYPIKKIPFKIPSDWVWCYLSDISIIQEGPGIRKHQYSESGIQFLTVTNILEGDVDLEKSKKYISLDQYKNYTHFTVNKGDVVTACSGGSWGKSAMYYLDKKIILNTSTLRLRFFNDLGDNKYLYYLTKAAFFKESLGIHTTGQQPNYGYSHYSKILIPLPPIPEQNRIVGILDEVLAAIDQAKTNFEKNLQNARAFFFNYLQKIFLEKEVIYEKVHLSDLAIDITDGDHLPPPKTSTGIPFITISNIDKKTHEIDFSDTFKVSEKYFQGLKENRKPQKGDVLYTVTGSFGIPVIVESEFKFCFQRHIGLIRPKKELNSKWLYYWILSPESFKQAIKAATGTAQKTVSLKSLRSFKIPKLPISEQLLMVTKLDQVLMESRKIESIYERKLKDLDELKKSILVQAFSGQLTASNKTLIHE